MLVGSVSIYILCISFPNVLDVFSETAVGPVPYWSSVRYFNFKISPRRVNQFWICLLIWTHHESYFNPCKFRVISFSCYWEISVYFSETSVGLGQFGTLVPYLVLLITRPRVNRFRICVFNSTRLKPYFNFCDGRIFSFSRFWEIDPETYGRFDFIVTGPFHVSIRNFHIRFSFQIDCKVK